MYSSETSLILNRLQNALAKPIQLRCADLKVIIDKGSITELQTIFPIIIDSIFAPQSSVSWGLRTTSSDLNSCDFQTLQHFLHPLGPMFKLIYTLLNDPLIKYEFPAIYLPLKVRQMLENSSKHPFYSEVITVNPQTKQIVSLMLNPFDYYIFHFAFHLVNPWHQRAIGTTYAVNWSTVYYMLCCDYVLHFLPTDPMQPVVPLLHFYTGKNPAQIISPSKTQRTSSLIKLSTVSEPPDFQMQQTCEYHPRSQIWRSETILTAFIDFWLQNDSINGTNSNFNATRELPTGEYIRIIRVLVKQLHAFSSSIKFDDTHMSELKRLAVPMIQGKMYIFLRNLVHRWPLDGSFRLVLELWLSFIQPWRYPGGQYLTKHLNQPEINPDVEDINLGPMKTVESEYLPFIAENLLTYVVIFQQLLPRFSRIDLSSPKMSLMLYRLTKVFNQPNLVNLLKEVESCVQNNPSPSHSFNTTWNDGLPPLSPTSNWSTNTSFNASFNSTFNSANASINDSNLKKSGKWSSVVRKKVFELEGPNFQYKPLFIGGAVREVHDLVVQVKKALDAAEKIVELRQKELDSQSFLSYFTSLFTYEVSSDEFSLEERKKVPVYLNYSLQHLKEMFQIDDFSMRDTTGMSFAASSMNDSSISSCRSIANDLSCLTPQKVRERVLTFHYQGNPDILPPQSNECEFLVKILYQVCNKINTEFQDKIIECYNRPDYMGRLTREFLCPPCTYYRFDKSSGMSIRVQENLPPRFNLRFLAQYKTLTYLAIGATVSVYNGHSLVLPCLIFLLLWFFYNCFKALLNRGNT